MSQACVDTSRKIPHPLRSLYCFILFQISFLFLILLSLPFSLNPSGCFESVVFINLLFGFSKKLLYRLSMKPVLSEL